MKTLVLSTALAVVLPAWAQAATVYPGCAVPTIKPGHKTFYVDPVHGSMSGDGSAGKPWHTLAEVLASSKIVAKASSPGNPVKAGSVIMLKTGDHGSVKMTGFFNNDFITVMPAPGQAPVIQSLQVTSSGKWMFQGLTFMPGLGAKRPAGIIAIGYGDWQGTTKDIVVDTSTVASVTDSSSWSALDWKSKPQGTGIWTRQGTSCVAATGNHIFNTLNGVAASASDSVIQGNKIELVFNDGVDITNSNVLVKNNVIEGGTNNPDSGFHADGIQGWSARTNGVQQTNYNVTIDGNTIVKFGDPTKSYMQGISIFDGIWQNLIIQNNVIAVNHWNAIALLGTSGSKILNNTVIATDPVKHPSWIQVRNGKNGFVPQKLLVRNNISTQLSIAGKDVQVDHNIAAKSIGIPGQKLITSGSVGNANRVVPSIVNEFANFNLGASHADMRLKSNSAAIGVGSYDQVPKQDIVGRNRVAPTDLGAYVR